MGLANFANLQDKLCQIVNINTPWGDLAQPQTPAAEAGAEGVGGEGAGRARRVGPLLSKTATRGAAAKDAPPPQPPPPKPPRPTLLQTPPTPPPPPQVSRPPASALQDTGR